MKGTGEGRAITGDLAENRLSNEPRWRALLSPETLERLRAHKPTPPMAAGGLRGAIPDTDLGRVEWDLADPEPDRSGLPESLRRQLASSAPAQNAESSH